MKPVVSKQFEGRRTTVKGEEDNEGEGGENEEVEWRIFRDALKVVAHDLTNRIIDVRMNIESDVLLIWIRH